MADWSRLIPLDLRKVILNSTNEFFPERENAQENRQKQRPTSVKNQMWAHYIKSTSTECTAMKPYEMKETDKER
jgi:hypothetical protein